MGKKGKEKNTKNKAKHSRLMAQKKHRVKSEKEIRKDRLKALFKKDIHDTDA